MKSKLMGLVVVGPAGAPCIQIADGDLCSPAAYLYEKVTGRVVVNGDSDFAAFRDGYFGKKVEKHTLAERLRAIYDSEFRERKNVFARSYNAGLKARKDLEKKIGYYVRL